MTPSLPPAVFADVAPSLDPARPSAPITWVALSADAEVTPRSSTFGTSRAGSSASGVRGGGDAEVLVYLRKPLVNDDAPLTLQPFLQRTSYVFFQGGGSAIRDTYSPIAGGGTYTQALTSETISTRVFVADSVALLGSVGAAYLHDARTPLASSTSTRDEWEPWGELGVGLWAGDGTLSLLWQLVGVNETATGEANRWHDVFWPRLALDGRIVVDRTYDLSATVAVLPDGIDVRGSAGVYPTKELGLSLFGEGRHGQIYWDSTTDYDSVLGGAQVSYWIDPRFSLAASFTPTWVSWATGTEWAFPVMLTATARLP